MQALRQRRRPVPAAVLAAGLGVSPRTIYRDVATLVAEGAPIAGEPGLGYVLRPGFFLPPLAFTEDESEAVVLGLRLVRQRGDPALTEAAEAALAKIEAVLPAAAGAVSAVAPLLAGPAPTPGIGWLPVLRGAIRAGTKLVISYRDGVGSESDRVVWPVAVGFFETVAVLAAWCELRGGFRHFRLDRIVAAEPTGERIPRGPRVLLAEWRASEGLRDLA